MGDFFVVFHGPRMICFVECGNLCANINKQAYYFECIICKNVQHKVVVKNSRIGTWGGG